MRIVHLAHRFFGAITAVPPDPDDLSWVDQVLDNADLLTQFRRMPYHDQAHAIGVARAVQADLADTQWADDPRWLAAALLHDLGKLDSRLGVYGRVVATVSSGVAGHDMADAWSDRSGFTRRVGLYLRHPELGADRIRLAGGPEEAAVWAAAHQDPERSTTTGFPEPVVTALLAADDD